MTFEELNPSAPVLRAVREAGYTVPSPIQAAAIPCAGRVGSDGCAQTGTGKTAARLGCPCWTVLRRRLSPKARCGPGADP